MSALACRLRQQGKPGMDVSALSYLTKPDSGGTYAPRMEGKCIFRGLLNLILGNIWEIRCSVDLTVM